MGQLLSNLLAIFYTKKLDIVVIGLENRYVDVVDSPFCWGVHLVGQLGGSTWWVSLVGQRQMVGLSSGRICDNVQRSTE